MQEELEKHLRKKNYIKKRKKVACFSKEILKNATFVANLF